MTVSRSLAPVLAVLALTGCSSLSAITSPPPAFDETAARDLLKSGPNEITGNADVFMRGQAAATCAGSVARLVPATGYADNWFGGRVSFSSTPEYAFQDISDSVPEFFAKPSPFEHATLTATCDSRGMFDFRHVADGSFYLLVDVHVGMFIMPVSVSQGVTLDVALTPRFAIATRKLPVNYPTYSDAEYAPFLKGGSAAITGQAFVVTRGGEAKRAAGGDIELMPATGLAKQWWNLVKCAASGPGAPRYQTVKDRRFWAAERQTKADADGRFAFDGLAPGEYIVFTTLTYDALCADYPGCISTQGGLIAAKVDVKENEKASAIVSDACSAFTQ